jgi:hypothetical protein
MFTTGSTGFTGFGTTSPTHLVHIAGEPRIDSAGSTPPAIASEGVNGLNEVITNSDVRDTALGKPDEWLLISINGTPYVIPAYEAP